MINMCVSIAIIKIYSDINITYGFNMDVYELYKDYICIYRAPSGSRFHTFITFDGRRRSRRGVSAMEDSASQLPIGETRRLERLDASIHGHTEYDSESTAAHISGNR